MQKGQALLVVLLVMGVVMTVGLSVVSRSVTEINISTTEDQAAKALQAAEAGVEQALAGSISSGATGSLGTENPAGYKVVKSNLETSDSGQYKIPYLMDAGDVATIDLGSSTSSQNMVICWGRTTAANIIGIEAILYYKKSTAWTVGRNGYAVGTTYSGFSPATENYNACLPDYKIGVTVNLRSAPLFTGGGSDPLEYLRIRMIGNGNPQPLAVIPQGWSLPSQGEVIESVGTAGDTAQKIVVTDPQADLPFMFDAALFSGGAVIQ